MASLVAPPLRRLPTTLLNLDCSADLTTYSRSLGPATQTRPLLPFSSDGLREQFETHRENILRQRHVPGDMGGGTAASPAQTPLMGHPEMPGHVAVHHQQQQQQHWPPAPPAYRQHPSAPHSRTQTPISHDREPYPPGPPPPHAYRHVPPAPPSQTQTPVADTISTYPPSMRWALEQSALTRNARSERNIVYNVVEDVHVLGDARNVRSQVIGSHKKLHAANLAAAEFMLDAGRWQVGEEPEVLLSDDGMLKLGITVGAPGGSRGERVNVYVVAGMLRG